MLTGTVDVSVPLAGAEKGNRLDAIQHVTEGRPALLIPEPDNPADPNAIAIWIDGRHAGYVAAAVAARFVLDQSVQGVITRVRRSPEHGKINGLDVKAPLTPRRTPVAA